MENMQYLKQVSGRIKLATILLTLVTTILGYLGYFLSEYTHSRDKHTEHFIKNEIRSLWKEWVFLAVCTVSLIASAANFAGHCYSLRLYWNKKTAYFDFWYQYAAGLLLAVTGMLYIVSAVNLYEMNCTEENGCQRFALKLSAGGVAVISGFVFATLGSVVLTVRDEVQRGIQ